MERERAHQAYLRQFYESLLICVMTSQHAVKCLDRWRSISVNQATKRKYFVCMRFGRWPKFYCKHVLFLYIIGESAVVYCCWGLLNRTWQEVLIRGTANFVGQWTGAHVQKTSWLTTNHIRNGSVRPNTAIT